MRSKIQFLSRKDAAVLAKFLGNSERPKETFNFHQLQGFLYTVASSPETIAPSEWLPMISNDEDIGFRNEREAQTILSNVMALYNGVNSAVLDRSHTLPTGVSFAEQIDANFQSDSSISLWSQGFIAGHDWLSESWDEYLIEEMEEEFGATLMVLTFFSSRELAKAYYDDATPKRKRGDQSFEKFAETVRSLFPDALASYAHFGRTIFEAISGHHPVTIDEPAKSTRIGRNQPCPCGSGKKYKKCCGGQIH